MKTRTKFRELGTTLRTGISHFCNEVSFKRVKRRSIEIDGTKVTFIGVVHTRRTFEKHKGLFEQAIKKSDALVVESKNPNCEFYGPINELAKKHGKKSYCFEAVRDISVNKGRMLRWYKGIGIVLLAVGMLTGIYTAVASGLDELKDFLTVGLGITMMFTGFACSMDAAYRLANGKIRDAVASFNTLRLIAKKEIEKLTIFYGMTHLVNILGLLKEKERTENEANCAISHGKAFIPKPLRDYL